MIYATEISETQELKRAYKLITSYHTLNACVIFLLFFMQVGSQAFFQDSDMEYEKLLQLSPFAPAEEWCRLGDPEDIHCWLSDQRTQRNDRFRDAQLLAASAYLYWCKNETQTAFDRISQAIALDAEDPRVLILSALILHSKEAVDRLTSVTVNNLWHEDAVIAISKCSTWKSVDDRLSLIRSLKHPKPYARLVEANLLREQGDRQGALRLLEQYLRVYKTGIMRAPEGPFSLQADLFHESGSYELAMDSCRKGLALTPRSRSLRLILALSLCELDRGKESLELAIQLEKEEPGAPVADYLMAKSLIAMEDYNKAMVYLERLMNDINTGPEALDHMIHIFCYKGEFDKIASYVNEFDKRSPNRKGMKIFSRQVDVAECYLHTGTLKQKTDLKPQLKSLVISRECCMHHVILAIGAIHNMGDNGLAAELIKGVEKAECNEFDLIQLDCLKHAISSGTEMRPVLWGK